MGSQDGEIQDLLTAAWAACRLCVEPRPANCIELEHAGLSVGRCMPEVASRLVKADIIRCVSGTSDIMQFSNIAFSDVLIAVADVLGSSTDTNEPGSEAVEVIDDRGIPIGSAPRALVLPLGLRMAGIHLTGFAQRDGVLQLLLAERNKRHHSHAGHLDTLVGGLRRPAETVATCLQREGWEEAGLPAAEVGKGHIFGTVDFFLKTQYGFARGRAVLADLILSPGTVPQPLDGTVEDFHWVSLDTIQNGHWPALPFKPTAALATAATLYQRGMFADADAGELSMILDAANLWTHAPRPIRDG